ncbi:hypothetical protein E2F46_01880 [Luteimonas aestuarii]|uniref:Uncharacterized protein n=1 Tax=Luteimonas aestuarii TaxID=453837 RepID=A0A4R5U4G9_9GAMM|nr:hypothetical protein [Luteimonas aestuarii]TDK28641.1 hypothetical protein E2F46_01880 [Luteimonas aestuarii]
MKSTITAVFAALLVCTTPVVAKGADTGAVPSEVGHDADFMTWLTALTDQDERYRRIALDTDAQVAGLTVILHRLFRGQTADARFMGWMGVAYPGYAHEQVAILRILHAHRKGLGR